MKAFNLKSWSEQQQVAAVILLATLVIALPCYFLLLPQIRKRHAIERDLDAMRTRLEQSNLLMGEDALIDRARREQVASQARRDEWSQAVAYLNAGAAETNSAVGSIDYKMALFEVEQRLIEKGRKENIQLPRNLGVRETVESDQDARMLMHQLRAVERLITVALELNIKSVRSVQPLPIRRHVAVPDGPVFAEEYPVHIQFYGSLGDLYDLLHGALGHETAMVLRSLMVAAATPESKDLLQVDAVMSALVFVQDPLVTSKPRPLMRVKPRGY